MLSDAQFQSLCDELLLRKFGYRFITCRGMKAGSMKTTKGTPDTYFYLDDGKYVLAEYTTQKRDLYEKIHRDITKCLDLGLSNTEKIIYCHTSSDLEVAEDQKLHMLCQEQNIQLLLYGIDTIASDLYHSYRTLAKDYLDIPLDTNQIFSIDEYVRYYDGTGIAAPLALDFILRKNELNELCNLVSLNKIVVLSGNPGTGKTRLALEAARRFSSEFGYHLLCIKSNGCNICDDITFHMENPGKYILVIDDGNTFSGLQFILGYINARLKEYDVHLIITVRDYAKSHVMDMVAESAIPAEMKIGKCTDDDIRKFIEVNLGITNTDYISQIIRIAEGNLRMAYMAGRLAKEKQSLSTIYDASGLYDSYYERYIKQSIFGNNIELCSSAGLLAFFNTARLDQLDRLASVLSVAGKTEQSFYSDIYALVNLEIAEIRAEKVAIVTDQCLGNYLLYYVFIKKKLVSLSALVASGFEQFRPCVTNMMNILLSIFSSDENRSYISSEICIAWDSLAVSDTELFNSFVRTFHTFRPEKSQLIVNEMIKKIDKIDVSDQDISWKSASDSDDILALLEGYAYSPYLSSAVQLFAEYVCTGRADIGVCLEWFKRTYSIDRFSSRSDYSKEQIIVKVLTGYSEHSWLMTKLYIRIAGVMLSTFFTPAVPDRRNSISIYSIQVTLTPGSEKYRAILWNKLIELAASAEHQKDIFSIVRNYPDGFRGRDEVTLFDKPFIEKIISVSDSINILERGKACRSLIRLWKESGGSIGNELDVVLNDEIWKEYSLFSDVPGWNRRAGQLDKHAEIRRSLCSYAETLKTDEQIIDFIKTADKLRTLEKDNYSYINSGVGIVLGQLCSDISRFAFLLHSYTLYGRNLDISPKLVIKSILNKSNFKTMYTIISDESNLNHRNEWFYACFYLLEEGIDEHVYETFANFVRRDTGPAIREDAVLDRFESSFPGTYVRVSKIMVDENQDVITSYFDDLFNHYSSTPERIFSLYLSAPDILKTIYFKVLESNEYSDFDGRFIRYFSTYDMNWMEMYASFLADNISNIRDSHTELIRSFWKSDNYMAYFDCLLHGFTSFKDYLIKCDFVSVLSDAFKGNEKDTKVKERKLQWLRHAIEDNIESQYLYLVFDIIAELDTSVKSEAVSWFIQLCSDFDKFRKISLQPHIQTATGSFIPVWQDEIVFYRSLLPLLTDLKYIEHRNLVSDMIESRQKQIEVEKVQEAMDWETS